MLTIGDRIKYFRKRRGITQAQLAAMSEIHPVSIRKYETNKMQPQQEQIEKISNALCLNSGALTGLDEKIHLETRGDLTGLLITLHKSGVLTLDGERDADGFIIDETAHFVPAPAIDYYFKIFGKKAKKDEAVLNSLEIKLISGEILHDLVRWEHLYRNYRKDVELYGEGRNDAEKEAMSEIAENLELVEMELRGSTQAIIH